jgi:anti-sigma factor RsiW
MNCDAVREDVDAWALGALPADDARAIEAHLESCDDCRALADLARETASALGYAVPLRSASATLKSRVMASAAILTDIGTPRRSRMWPAAVAALLVLGIAAATWGTVTTLRMNDLDDRNATLSAGATAQANEFVRAVAVQEQLSDTVETQDAVLKIVLEPDVQRTELVGTGMAPAASGRCVWSRAQASGALIVAGLQPPPEGSVYTMWIIYENKWLDAGDFTVDETGEGQLLMDQWGASRDDGWGEFEGFAVTLESSDAPAPSGDTIMRSVRAE